MKVLKWNLGIMMIRFGYFVRKYNWGPSFFSLRWKIGVFIVKYGDKLRGGMPYKTWKWNHI